MKKVFKRAIPFVLVVVMCLCMAAPALAHYDCESMFTGFPTQYSGNNTGYVGLIQASMYAYSTSTRTLIANSGGIDCVNGSGTIAAVKEFQSDMGLPSDQCDGIVGNVTWPVLGSQVVLYYGSSTYGIYKIYPNEVSGFPVMKKYTNSSALYYYCYGYPKSVGYYDVED